MAAVLLWAGPPGIDLAGHVYQRVFFVQHGFSLWNNFWYAGRYSFITYSVLYYPLAALIGIKLLALASIVVAAFAFALVVEREWGPPARLSSRSFAVVWAGTVISATFPFALGVALALLAVLALQKGRRAWFAAATVLTLAASALAFVLLALLLLGVGIARLAEPRRLVAPGAVVLLAGLAEALVLRAFPEGGRFPFSTAEFVPVVVFCSLGILLTWRIERARPLLCFFVVYFLACVAAFVIPSQLGENIERVRFAAVPLAVLALSLRAWRPLSLALPALVLAGAWNVSPLAANFSHASADPTAQESYWQPAAAFLHSHLGPSYRVEAVDSVGHWAAVYLPEAGIPVARGWYRQDDFPENQILYDEFGRKAYLHWLRSLAVRYVVLTDAPSDYSARAEAKLLRSGRSGLRPVFRTPHVTIYAVRDPTPLVTGPARARVLALTQARITIRLAVPGRYRVAVRYSPYWHASRGCLTQREDGMLGLQSGGGRVVLTFKIGALRALKTLVGADADACS